MMYAISYMMPLFIDMNVIQVKQLCDVGVSALRVSSVDCLSEVAKGKYRFGMFFTDFCKQGQL